MMTLDRPITLIALATILIAWVVGSLRHKDDLIPFVKKAFPSAVDFKTLSNKQYVCGIGVG